MQDVSAGRQHWLRQWAWVSASLCALSIVLGAGGWLWRADQALYDLALTLWPQPRPNDVVIISIDDDSIQALGRWPWPRSVHATLIDKLNTAPPKSILLDLLLSEPSEDPLQDDVLARAIAQSGHVVLPVSPSALSASNLPSSTGQPSAMMLPLPALADKATLGHSDVDIDPDGVVRNLHLRAGPQVASFPSLAMAMLQVGNERPVPDLDVKHAPPYQAIAAGAWQRDEQVKLRFGGPHRWVPSVPYASVLKGDVPAALFANKHVLIGVTALGLGHRFNTPVSSLGGAMSGVEVTAEALQMLRHGPTIHTVGSAWACLWSALMLLALMWMIWRMPPKAGLMLALGSAAFAGVVSLISLGWLGWWLPPATFMLCALLAYPLWSWRRLELSHQYMSQTTALINQALPPGPEAPRDAGMSRDATEARIAAASQATERLQQARQSLSDVLAALPVAVIVADPQLNVQAINALATQVLKPSGKPVLLGQELIKLLTAYQPIDATSWAALLQKVVVSQEAATCEVEGPNRQHLWVHVTPFHDAGQAHAGLLISMTDVSQLRLAERQRDDLLAFIAHDIRSPQSSLTSMVEMHRLGFQTLPIDTLMTHVDNLARSTIGLCEELLTVMKSETQPLALSQVKLSELARLAMQEVAWQARAGQLQLTLVQSQSTEAQVRGDASQIRRALINLMTNAIKFSPTGGEILVELQHDEEMARVAIKDQGPGIPSADLGKLFRRYQRLDSGSHLRVSAGVGLGLVFVDTVARRHGGTIEVASTVGEGSSFTLSLPIDWSEPEPDALAA
jgi:CHASE2 domain-containing sensor protein/signal transduction histidine kinase